MDCAFQSMENTTKFGVAKAQSRLQVRDLLSKCPNWRGFSLLV
jgi:hypothetical protein